MFNNNPMSPQFDPSMSASQRLNYMEQQYPQFAPTPQIQPNSQQYPAFNPRLQGIPQNTPQYQPQTGYIKGRAVTSLDEAKASMIDFDGSLHVFTDIANGKIYTKQINLDGTASLKVYTLEQEKPTEKTVEEVSNSFICRDEFESFRKQINTRMDSISKFVKDVDVLLGGSGDVQYTTNNGNDEVKP